MGAAGVFANEGILAVARFERDEAEGFAATLEDAVVVGGSESEEGGGFLEESFFGGEVIVGGNFDLEADGGL